MSTFAAHPSVRHKNIMDIALLLHCITCKETFSFSHENIEFSITKTKDTNIIRCYHDMCSKKEIDEGDPFRYETCVLIKGIDLHNEDNCYRYHPYMASSPYSRLLIIPTIIGITFDSFPGMVRIISSEDSFETCFHTSVVVEERDQTSFIDKLHKNIGQGEFDIFKSLYFMYCSIKDIQSPIHNVIYNLNLALQAYFLDQFCIHICVGLETLFSPATNTELSHQISYNVAQFVGKDRQEKIQIYKNIKKYYNERSRFIHGDIPNQDNLTELSIKVFGYISSSLKKIAYNPVSIEQFSTHKTRIKFMDSLMFA